VLSIHKISAKSIKKSVTIIIDVPGSFFRQPVKGNKKKGAVGNPLPPVASALGEGKRLFTE
jgi:hypothetical protein